MPGRRARRTVVTKCVSRVGGVWVKVALAGVRTSAQIEHIGVGQRVPREMEVFQSGQPGGESVGEVFKGARHGRTAAQIAPAQFQGLHTTQSLQRRLHHCSDAQCEVSASSVCVVHVFRWVLPAVAEVHLM